MYVLWPAEGVWELWGIRKDRWETGDGARDRLALFLVESDAYKYITKSSLKKPTDTSAFRKASLLSGYDYADVELVEDIPVDPKL